MIPEIGSITFAKLICGGNDFLVLDCRHRPLPADPAALTVDLCDRRQGVGADGAIFLIPDAKAPFRIVLFNADGSRAAVSYNGSRCLGRYAVAARIAESPFSFASDAGEIGVTVDGGMVTVSVPAPQPPRLNLQLEQDGEIIPAHFVVAGVPYLVLYRDDLRHPWVERVPWILRSHPEFPGKTNVAVVRRREHGGIEARFFERGVDEETPSSGSGTVAIAAIAAALDRITSPLVVHCAGGEFPVNFVRRGDTIGDVTAAGEVKLICTGIVSLDPGVREACPLPTDGPCAHR